MSHYPPTVVVIHPKERRSKCTVEPLRPRTDFLFWRFPQFDRKRLDGYVRLGFDGPLLSRDDPECGLLVLDATWRFAETMEVQFADIPVRSLPAWKTAYPRVSKIFENPEQGLATVEAVYAAYQILGRDTAGLLDEYHWADEFLRLNSGVPK